MTSDCLLWLSYSFSVRPPRKTKIPILPSSLQMSWRFQLLGSIFMNFCTLPLLLLVIIFLTLATEFTNNRLSSDLYFSFFPESLKDKGPTLLAMSKNKAQTALGHCFYEFKLQGINFSTWPSTNLFLCFFLFKGLFRFIIQKTVHRIVVNINIVVWYNISHVFIVIQTGIYSFFLISSSCVKDRWGIRVLNSEEVTSNFEIWVYKIQIENVQNIYTYRWFKRSGLPHVSDSARGNRYTFSRFFRVSEPSAVSRASPSIKYCLMASPLDFPDRGISSSNSP